MQDGPTNSILICAPTEPDFSIRLEGQLELEIAVSKPLTKVQRLCCPCFKVCSDQLESIDR